jgi:hypothetical protein
MLLREDERLLTVPRLQYFEISFQTFEHLAQAFTHQCMVINDENFHRLLLYSGHLPA